MKKYLVTATVLFIGVVFFSACSKNETELTPTTFETVNDLTGLTSSLREDSLSPVSAAITYTNQTEQELAYREAYILEKKIEDAWHQLPYLDEDGFAFIEIAYILSPESTSEWMGDWEEIYGPLEAGDYRLVKDFLIVEEPGDYDIYHIATEFSID